MNGPEYFAAIQKSILSQAAQMLKPGGYMLYSTCTFSKLEDEDNIQLFQNDIHHTILLFPPDALPGDTSPTILTLPVP